LKTPGRLCILSICADAFQTARCAGRKIFQSGPHPLKFFCPHFSATLKEKNEARHFAREFVEGLFEANREKFGPKRKDGAQRITEAQGGLHALRRLRIRSNEQRRNEQGKARQQHRFERLHPCLPGHGFQ
jgi:hypothetical protein